jgi:transposase
MEVLYPHCAGLDVHKQTVVAGARHIVNGTVTREVRTFGTTTKDLLALSEWLASQGCTHVAMEATGVYWKPVWHILSDGEFTLVLANAKHVKNVPGRKTDVNDATWLADLMAHGLIRGSFVPDSQTQELRGLLRTRKQFVRERSSHVQRLQKTLEDANIKLDSVISDILGLSGRAMIEALIAGETDPAALAALAHRRIKALPAVLREALRGRVTDHHRFLLKLHLCHIKALDLAIEADRSGGRYPDRAFSPSRPAADHHSRGRRAGRSSHPRRDRRRHDPFSQRRTPALLGRFLSPE